KAQRTETAMVTVGTVCKRRCWHPIYGLFLGCGALFIIKEIIQLHKTVEEKIIENVARQTFPLSEANGGTVDEEAAKSPGEIQQTRIETLRKVCQVNSLNKNLVISELWKGFFFVDQEHKVVYCGVPKVGCTFLKRLFYVLSGKSRSK
ncbi:unnamed protein product, partial [Owenia fusiformis]